MPDSPLEFSFARTVSVDGKLFATMEDAQRYAIATIIRSPSLETLTPEASAVAIVASKDKILDILTMTEKSKPKARAINGGKKTRKPKTPAPSPVTTPTGA